MRMELHYDALGRPKTASEYEFEGGRQERRRVDELLEAGTSFSGTYKSQAKALSGKWNAQMQKMVETHNASIKGEITAAEGKLRSEWRS